MTASVAVTLNKSVASFSGNIGGGTGTLTTTFPTPTGQIVSVSDGVITNVYGSTVGSGSVLNTEYFNNIISQFGAVQNCAVLQAEVDQIWAGLQSQVNDINAQVAVLLPIISLLTAPGLDLGAIVTWITNFISAFLTPYAIPYTNYATQLTALIAQIATLTTAVNDAAARIGGSCTITIPPITGL